MPDWNDFTCSERNWNGNAPVPSGPAPGEFVPSASVPGDPAESGPAESEPAESEPAESEPAESEPAESEPIESEPAESEPVESAAVDPPAGEPVPAPAAWPWIASTAALAAALIVTLIAAAVRGRKRKTVSKKNAIPPAEISHTEQPAQPARPALAEMVPQVGKLHQQGARGSQQDCFSVSPTDLIPTFGLLAVVADGMGGLTDGDKVSQAAVSAMMNGFYTTQGQPEEVLLTLLGQANSEVNRLLGPDGYGKSGSTLVAGLVRGGKFYTLSVGDSRVCLYRDGALYQLNREHIFRHELEQRAVNGEEELRTAYTHPRGAGLTSYLGMGKLRYVDMPAEPIEIREGDKFLLMSDGVYNALTRAELTACLNASAGEAAVLLEQAVRAKNYSNQDNYTAVILGF